MRFIGRFAIGADDRDGRSAGHGGGVVCRYFVANLRPNPRFEVCGLDFAVVWSVYHVTLITFFSYKFRVAVIQRLGRPAD